MNSLYFNNVSGDGTTGTSPVLADPLFANAAGGDYHVAATSPAKAAGTSTGAPSADFDGVTRPNPPTIGAFEATKGSTTTGIGSNLNPSVFGQSITFTATVASAVSGTITGSVTFYDGVTSLGSASVSGGSASVSTSALTQGSHSITVTYSGDSSYLTSTSTALTQQVNATSFPAPSSFSATMASTTQINLSWTAVATATSYDIYRASSATSGVYTFLASTASTTYPNSGLSQNSAYSYKVRAVNASNTSAFSTPDAAVTMTFTDDPLSSSITVKAVHMTELRTAVSAMHAAAGLGSTSFTYSVASGVVIHRADLIDLRTALDASRAQLGLPTLSYADTTITAGTTTVKAAQFQEIRTGVK